MNLFDQQVTLSVNSVVLIITAVVILGLIATVIFLIIRQNKLKKSLQPKYGFLGRSLYATLTVLVLGGGLIFGLLSIRDGQVFNIEAKKHMTADLLTNSLLKEGEYTYVSFKAVPTVDGLVWGKTGDQFTIYWTFEGDNGESYSFIEEARSNNERSGLQKYLVAGSYKVTVNIIFEGSTYTFSKTATF